MYWALDNHILPLLQVWKDPLIITNTGLTPKFYLSLALVANRIVDYVTNKSYKTFEWSIVPLSNEMFNHAVEDQRMFLDKLIKRANKIG